MKRLFTSLRGWSVSASLALLCAVALSSGAETMFETARFQNPLGLPYPVEVDLPLKDKWLAADGLSLEIVCSGDPIPAQLLFPRGDANAKTAKLCAILPPGTVGETQYALEPGWAFTPAFQFVDDGVGTLSIYEGMRFVTSYQYGVQLPPPQAPADRARSSYLHPLVGLDGERLTEDYPDDHYHHRGIFIGWPHYKVGEEDCNPWHVHGSFTRFERWLGMETGPVFARVTMQNGMYVADRKVGSEILEITVWRSGEIGQAIDLDFTWTVMEPTTIRGADGKGYGGFNLRMPQRKNSVTHFPEGLQGNSDEKRSPWADTSGLFPGGESTSGISILVDPTYPRFPAGWTVRVSDDYGFLGVNWPGVEPVTVKPNRPVVAKHRVWVHRGDVKKGKVKEAYELYAQGPELVLIMDTPEEKKEEK